jgi:hypothetical protein
VLGIVGVSWGGLDHKLGYINLSHNHVP